MGLNTLDSLDAIRQRKAQRAEYANRKTANWLSNKILEKGAVTGQFLQEFSEESPHFDAEKGKGFVAIEHVSPINFRRRGLCTRESLGECFGCEMNAANPGKGWAQKDNAYVLFLADVGEGLKTYVIQRNANSSFFDSLLVEIDDEGSITDSLYRITKTGEGKQTNWNLKRVKGDLRDASDAEVFTKDDLVREIPYAEQPTFYDVVKGNSSDEDDDSEPQTSPKDAGALDW